jgi:hypothetical protein
MRLSHWLRQQAHRRCYGVCKRYRRDLERTRGGKRSLTQLLSSIENVDRHATERRRAIDREKASSKGAEQTCRELRVAIRQLSAIGAAIAHDHARDKTIDATVRVPRKASRRALINDASAIQDRVTPLIDVFADYGLPRQVILGLPSQIATIERSNLDRDMARISHLIGVKEIERDLAQGDRAIVVLEAILSATRGNTSKAVTDFRRARRVGRTRAKPRRRPGLKKNRGLR